MEIPLKGNFNDFSPSKIFIYLNRNRKTGTFIVNTPTFTKKVYLDKGDAIFASSTYEDDRLGEMLIKLGKITMEQYEESVKLLQQTKGKRHGAILVELGYLTPKDLFWSVKYQVKEMICSLFLLEDAEYEFIEAEIPPNEVITLKISMGNLIYEGAKKIDKLSRIKKELPDLSSVLRLSTDPASLFQDLELTPQDRNILSLVDGKKTIKELMDYSSTNSFETLRTLYALLSIGIIEEKEKVLEMAEEAVSFEEILAPLSEEQEAFIKRLNEVYSHFDGLSAHELLEIDEISDAETVKKNYYRLTKEFHPDRYLSSTDPSIKDKLSAIFDAVTRAYILLKDEEERKEYFTSLREIQKEEDLTAKQAGEQFKHGIKEFKTGNYEGAVACFKLASQLVPEKAQYWSYLSLSFSKIPNRLKDSEEALLQAIKIEPKNEEHYANLGQIYLKAGMKESAHNQFEKALTLNPENAKAKKGLKLTAT